MQEEGLIFHVLSRLLHCPNTSLIDSFEELRLILREDDKISHLQLQGVIDLMTYLKNKPLEAVQKEYKKIFIYGDNDLLLNFDSNSKKNLLELLHSLSALSLIESLGVLRPQHHYFEQQRLYLQSVDSPYAVVFDILASLSH